MMNIRRFNVLVIALFCLACKPEINPAPLPEPDTPVVPVPDPNAIEIVNGTFENDLEGWTRVDYANGDKVTLEIVDGEGVKDSKALKIQQFPENGKCCVGVKQKLTGLDPDQMYRMTARVRYSDVPNGEGTGPVIFRPNSKQYWNSSKYLYGTELQSWTNITVDFMSDDNGEAEIVAALGFWQGGMANGGRSTGTAYFDNISVKKVSDELFTLEGEHMRLFIEPTKVTVSNQILSQWVANMDKMYESYAELMGATPHEGRRLAIQTTRGIYSGYWALAGYPILWSINYTAVEDSFAQMRDYDDWCFGILHEIGHVFNLGNSSWNWNDEMFANFRMHYGLEMNNGKVYQTNADGKSMVYTGSEILNLYQVDYNNTIGTKVNDNGIHYMLARMASALTWEPYKKTFKYLQEHGGNGSSNKYDKFVYFVNTLDRFAKESNPNADVWGFFSELEIESIKKQLQ